GIRPFSAGLTVGAVADDVRLIAVLAGKFVDVGMTPRIERDLLPQIRPIPLSYVSRPGAQRFETLLAGGEQSGAQLVLREGLLEIIDLDARRHGLRFVALLEHAWRDQRRE